jgi:hypothetical protein
VSAEEAVDLAALLAGRPATYRGRGVEQDGTEFDATLTVAAIAGGAAVILDVHIDQPGEPPYQEHGVLARGEDGVAAYVSVSANAPFHRIFRLRRSEVTADGARAVFGWGGAPDDTSAFREEVTLSAYESGDVGLGWAWGAPGEDFVPRSGARLSPAS